MSVVMRPVVVILSALVFVVSAWSTADSQGVDLHDSKSWRVLFEGAAHGQLIFDTPDGDRLMRVILQFFSQP
jgi:hypothetical protein